MVRPYRKPLVVMTPKMLLRYPKCVSPLSHLTEPGGHFQPVLEDPRGMIQNSNTQVQTLIFCTGKHYYTLEKELSENRQQFCDKIALIRIEELCPFPADSLVNVLHRYPEAIRKGQLIWSQEEHRNMGAWSYVKPRFEYILKQKVCQKDYADHCRYKF